MSEYSELYSFIKEQFLSSAKKLRGNYPAISIRNEDQVAIYPLKRIYNLVTQSPHLYLFILKNEIRHPKLIFFMGIVLANQSSDLLVQIGRDYAKNQSIHLLQYSIHPKTNRVNLIGLKQLKDIEKASDVTLLLKAFRSKFRIKLKKLSSLL